MKKKFLHKLNRWIFLKKQKSCNIKWSRSCVWFCWRVLWWAWSSLWLLRIIKVLTKIRLSPLRLFRRKSSEIAKNFLESAMKSLPQSVPTYSADLILTMKSDLCCRCQGLSRPSAPTAPTQSSSPPTKTCFGRPSVSLIVMVLTCPQKPTTRS